MIVWTNDHVHIIKSYLSLQKWHRVTSSKPATSSDESLNWTAVTFISHTNTQICRTSSTPLPQSAESRGLCAMPTDGHDAHRPSLQLWVSLGGETVRAARASHWVIALELKGTFQRGKSEKWVFWFGQMAQLQVQRPKSRKCHEISLQKLIIQ